MWAWVDAVKGGRGVYNCRGELRKLATAGHVGRQRLPLATWKEAASSRIPTLASGQAPIRSRIEGVRDKGSAALDVILKRGTATGLT